MSISHQSPAYVKVRIPTEVDRYKKGANLTKELNNIAAQASTGQFTYYMEKLQELKNEMLTAPRQNISGNASEVTTRNTESTQSVALTSISLVNHPQVVPVNEIQLVKSTPDAILAPHSSINNVASSSMQSSVSDNAENINVCTESFVRNDDVIISTSLVNDPKIVPVNENQLVEPTSEAILATDRSINNVESSSMQPSVSDIAESANVCTESFVQNDDVILESQQVSAFTQSQSLAVLSSIENIKMPCRFIPAGRPKGSLTTTAIGTKPKARKRKQSDIGVSLDASSSKLKFLERNQDEQAVTMIKWLTNLNRCDIGKKKISIRHIIKDTNVFNRLRNDMVFLGSLKTYLDAKCFEYLKNEVAKLHGEPLQCSLCKLVLKGRRIMCVVCLDWFHSKCIGFTKSIKEDFICSSC